MTSRTLRYSVSVAGWRAIGRGPRVWCRNDGFILTALGYAVLEEAQQAEAREIADAAAPACAFCGLTFEMDEAAVPVGAGRHIHEGCNRACAALLSGGGDHV